MIDGLKRALANGARAYWVCPLVEESEKSDLAAAAERATMLREALGGRVGLVHGRLKGAERDAAMAAFKAGETSVLVATTVIEVGVDVPQASIMVVEHAERFGLAQLHQLRGRVGRGSAKSTCLLVYHPPLGAVAKQRLAALRATDDGFVIAEEDLRLRGAGRQLDGHMVEGTLHVVGGGQPFAKIIAIGLGVEDDCLGLPLAVRLDQRGVDPVA